MRSRFTTIGAIPVFSTLVALFMIAFLPTTSLHATHDNWYFVYVLDDYVQGSWIRSQKLYDHGSTQYLRPLLFIDMLGTVELDIVTSILDRLKQESPEDYRWKGSLRYSADTLYLTTADPIPNWSKVKNELLLSITMQNGFRYVSFRTPKHNGTFGMQQVEYPYFDLVIPSGRPSSGEPGEDENPAQGESVGGVTAGEGENQIGWDGTTPASDNGRGTDGVENEADGRSEERNPDPTLSDDESSADESNQKEDSEGGLPIGIAVAGAIILGGLGFVFGRSQRRGTER